MYFEELRRSMKWLGDKPDTIFIGQAVEAQGTAMFNTLVDVPASRRIEFPVAEEMQMGIAIGMAMTGTVPITIFPRWNFLLLAINQLVNHLDRMPDLSNESYAPKMIIRTSIGSQRPLHPQHQHIGDFTECFRLMLKNVQVIRIEEPEEIFPAYQMAYESSNKKSTIIVEYGDFYNEK